VLLARPRCCVEAGCDTSRKEWNGCRSDEDSAINRNERVLTQQSNRVRTIDEIELHREFKWADLSGGFRGGGRGPINLTKSVQPEDNSTILVLLEQWKRSHSIATRMNATNATNATTIIANIAASAPAPANPNPHENSTIILDSMEIDLTVTKRHHSFAFRSMARAV
jgi:hypothetical protein